MTNKVFLYLYIIWFLVEILGVAFYFEPLHEQALMDMSEKNSTLFHDLDRGFVHSSAFHLKKFRVDTQVDTWCKAQKLFSLEYVPTTNMWVTTGHGDVVFRPYQKYGFHSYDAESLECSEKTFLVLMWRTQHALKTGDFGINSPLMIQFQ